ncbi:MAG: 4Fe-4S binding protein [Desulfohalobiaceae bacterium]|nr:4Fe-4S binding protein [Desulfohalobiaceae bacterium]
MKNEFQLDSFLEKRLTQYDQWMAKGQISFSSEVFALCSCCSCCCHELQIIRRTGRNDIMMRSEYAAVTDFDSCIHCGNCEERCLFNVRIIQDAELEFDQEKCFGCGLCVPTCPVEAISMATR